MLHVTPRGLPAPRPAPHFTLARTRYDKLMTGHERGYHERKGGRRAFSFPSRFMNDAGRLVHHRHDGGLPNAGADIRMKYVAAVVACTNRSPEALAHWLRKAGLPFATVAQAERI